MSKNIDLPKFDFIFKSAIFVLFTVMLFYRAQLGFIIFYDADSYGYLRPAVRLAENFSLDHLYARPVLYSWIIGFFLLFIKKIAMLGVVQHVLGAISFVIYGAGIYKLVSIIQKQWLKVVCCFINLSFGFFIFMSPYIILNENLIRPEGIINFFFSIIFYNIICIIVSETARWQTIVSLVTMSLIIYLLKPHLGIQALLGIILALALSPTKKNLLVIISSITVVYVLLFLPESIIARKLDSMSPVFLPRCLVVFNAGAVKEVIERDIAENKTVSEREVKLLKAINFELQETARTGGIARPLLGYEGDRLFYANKIIQEVDVSFSNQFDQANFYWHIFLKALINKPNFFYDKIIKQIDTVYSLDADSIRPMRPFYIIDQLSGSLRDLKPDLESYEQSGHSELLKEYKNDLVQGLYPMLAAPDVMQSNQPYTSKIPSFLKWLHYLFVMANILILFFVFHFWACPKMYSPVAKKLLFFNIYIFLSVLMTHITTVVVNSMDIPRYINFIQFWTLSFILITYFSVVRLVATMFVIKSDVIK